MERVRNIWNVRNRSVLPYITFWRDDNGDMICRCSNQGPGTVQRGAGRHSSSCSSTCMVDLGSEERSCHTCDQDCRCSYVTRREDISRACERGNSNDGGQHGTKSSDDVNTDRKCYSCAECGRTFARRNNFYRHKITHSGQKPFACDDCGKAFSRRWTLVQHKLTHSGEKRHHCDDCGKSFAQRGHLVTHQLIHSGEKRHSCDDCGKSFTQRAHLVTHQLTHSDEKRHSCDDWENVCSPTLFSKPQTDTFSREASQMWRLWEIVCSPK